MSEPNRPTSSSPSDFPPERRARTSDALSSADSASHKHRHHHSHHAHSDSHVHEHSSSGHASGTPHRPGHSAPNGFPLHDVSASGCNTPHRPGQSAPTDSPSVERHNSQATSQPIRPEHTPPTLASVHSLAPKKPKHASPLEGTVEIKRPESMEPRDAPSRPPYDLSSFIVARKGYFVPFLFLFRSLLRLRSLSPLTCWKKKEEKATLGKNTIFWSKLLTIEFTEKTFRFGDKTKKNQKKIKVTTGDRRSLSL